MVRIMAVVNLTPDSFWAPSRVSSADALARISTLRAQGADIIDIGAVSSRPGAADVSVEQEWARLEPVLSGLDGSIPVSIDTTRSEIVRRVWSMVGTFIVNDISAGEDDPEMLPLVGKLGLEYIAMHKRGNPRTMDGLCSYEGGVVSSVMDYFREFATRASECGVSDWILDPGLGFAKTPGQNWELLGRLYEFKSFGKPILVGAADKRFTGGDTDRANRLAVANGADILRVHDVEEAVSLRDSCRTQTVKGLF